MKCLNYIVVFLLLSVGKTYGCNKVIANPTYDFSFGMLFGPKGENLNDIGPQDRLADMLTSVLRPMLKIEVKEVSFKTPKNTIEQIKNSIFNILTQCKCKKLGTDETHYVDIKILMAKSANYVERNIFHGDPDILLPYGEGDKHKNIILVFIDEVLPAYKSHEVFYIRPCDKKVCGKEEEIQDGTLSYDSPLQIFIQLPLLPKVKEKNDYTQNEWLKLLGKSNTSLARTCELVKKEFSNKYVLNAIKLLHHLIQDKDYTLTLLLEYRQIEEQYVSDQEQAEKKAKLEQSQAQLAKIIAQIEKTEAEIDKMNTYIRKVTLIKDITKFSKTDQKESFKFAKMLKNLSKKDLEKLLNDKAKKNQKVQNYLNTITQSKAEFNDNSMDEENSFEDL